MLTPPPKRRIPSSANTAVRFPNVALFRSVYNIHIAYRRVASLVLKSGHAERQPHDLAVLPKSITGIHE
jgi:hypothetical protein